MKAFIFLYPITQIINFEIDQYACATRDRMKNFKQKYATMLNNCIDIRYRQNGYTVFFAKFNDTVISSIIDIRSADKIINVGLNYSRHITKQSNGEYLYPDSNYILSQLGIINTVRVAGFHMWDCVDKLAEQAYSNGLNTLVDEDLTENFSLRIYDSTFRIHKYPTYNPGKDGEASFHRFIKVRANKPWLWQKY